MKNEIIVSGHQEFMGREIPVIVGGFGLKERCISDKTAAELHGMETKNLRARITDNIKRFHPDVDFMDLAQRAYSASTLDCVSDPLELLLSMGYSKQAIKQAEHIYILSRRGYFKLVKILETDQAWDVYNQLLDDYFVMEDHIQNGIQFPNTDFNGLSPQLQLLINMEIEQKRQAAALAKVNGRLNNICEIVSLDANAWRDRSKKIIVQIADRWGGAAHIQDVHNELYRLLEQTAHVDLKRRVENRRRRMAEEGVCKSRRGKLNRLDIIADDPKLMPIYLDLVKRMAIKNNVDMQGLFDEQA